MHIKTIKSLVATGLLLSAMSYDAQAALTSIRIVYSDISNVYWTEDANLLGTMISTQGYDNVVNAIIAVSPSITDTPNLFDGYSGRYSLSDSDFEANGRTTWFGAQAFTHYLNSINYGGKNQWRLPDVGSNPQSGFDQTGSELGQLFYGELGGSAGNSIPDTNFFTNEQSYGYWSGTEYVPNPNFAWVSNVNIGNQHRYNKVLPYYVWAVSPGPVSSVPVPAAAWLMLTGLVALTTRMRRGYAG